MDKALNTVEGELLKRLKGRFGVTPEEDKRKQIVLDVIRSIFPSVTPTQLNDIWADMNDLSPINEILGKESIEDIMINNTQSIFIYDQEQGSQQLKLKIKTQEELNTLVDKLKLYATNELAKGNILDIHLPNGSRANVVSSPLGYDVTIRKFKEQALSILDLINTRELDYQMAARLWIYVDGFKVRPANIVFGGVPAAGKTTLLNAMFSFFRPEERIITIEETYELDTTTQENCVRLETSEDMPMVELVKNSLRMRPDMIIIGEVRGAEANDMIAAMNIGKICMTTIHASSTRDIINRLQHSPMNVPKDILSVIDALVVLSQVFEGGKLGRKVVQISEISGLETQVLLSDLYKFDYRTHKAAPILPSITYRDAVASLLGVTPGDILAEENIRANILYKLNTMAKRDLASINEVVRNYYYEPEETLKKLGLSQLQPIVKV